MRHDIYTDLSCYYVSKSIVLFLIVNIIITFFIVPTYVCCPVIVTQHSFLQRQYTPLLQAAESGQIKVIEILIKEGADIEARNDVS